MRRNSRPFWRIPGAFALLIAALAPVMAVPASAPAGSADELDGLRRKCIAAARAAQQLDEAVGKLEHGIDLMGRDAAGRQRGLGESRVEQAQLLGEIERFARHPPNRFAVTFAAPIDRLRSEMLLEAVVPALHVEARALTAEIARIKALRGEIAAKESELGTTRAVLSKNREDLAQLIAQRLELDRRMLPPDAGAAARIAKLGHDAKDIADLIKRADAATDRHDKELLARARATLPRSQASALTPDTADPTRPHDVRAFEPSFSVLTTPVAGTLNRRFGAADASATASQGLGFAGLPGAEIVAPFDGRIIYAGPFGDLGLVLIIRHGGLYHSLLAGLGRVDARIDGWVVAGEPVGAMPGAVDNASGSALYFELRRDGRPVDPQPWLAPRDEARGGQDEDQKVHE